ncbi:MAG: rhomboid family intramembrane serine protease [Ignavibacteriae bacterium HGW-Ignavibacteriae-1]|jgi:membrane associated rhomboid family serine protease|nr:MAG: rhomboid family intramembrane serine protease [Ignavibacteriae bacterium HGW-Ignavibacteriae-1]
MDIENSPVAIVIFAVTVLISLYTLYKNNKLYYAWVLSPPKVVHEKKFYLLITSGFLHADLMHLLFNMLTFYFFGFALEQIIGSLNFLIIYLVSLVLSSVPTVIRHKDNYSYGSVGASGAISGILFASIMVMPNAGIMIFPVPIPIPAWIFGILYLLWSYFAAKRANDNINHDAHFYGALTGIIMMIILIPGIINHFIQSF